MCVRLRLSPHRLTHERGAGGQWTGVETLVRSFVAFSPISRGRERQVVVSWVRSKVGRVLRESGVIAPVPDAFTPTQVEQIRSVIADQAQSTPPPETVRRDILDSYASAAPSAQLALDIFPGEWSSKLPDELNVTSGHAELFADARIETAIEWFGDAIDGARVCELGPLEGGHTYMLDRAGAEVYAIESNSRAFVKCLISKELLGMPHARFLRGDFVQYLRTNSDRYDLMLASGVLYHMVDPMELLRLMAAFADHLVIWTHYFDADIVMNSDLARQFQAEPDAVQIGDTTYTLHPREYLEALTWGGFCGGPETYARWMERQDILDCLDRLGFNDVEVAFDHPDHQNGPSFMLLARR